MKKTFVVLMIILFSSSGFCYNLDDFEFKGLWHLKEIVQGDKKLFKFDLKKIEGADPIGFRHSYYKSSIKDHGVEGLGLFVLPSFRLQRFSYFIRINMADSNFHLFEIVGTRGHPINALFLDREEKRYLLEKE